MKEIHSPLPPETTEVLYSNQNIQRKVLESFSWVNKSLDGCTESDELAMTVVYDAIWNGFVGLEKRCKTKINNRSYAR